MNACSARACWSTLSCTAALVLGAAACAVGSSGAPGEDDAGGTSTALDAATASDVAFGAREAGLGDATSGASSDAGSSPPSPSPSHDAGAFDSSVAPPSDAGAQAHDAAPSQDASPLPPPVDAGACTPLINEILTGVTGSASYEYVEIYNPCPTTFDLSGWKVAYRAGTSTSSADPSYDVVLYVWTSGSIIASGAFLLYAGGAYAGATDGALSSGLKDGAGAVGLRTPSGALAHSVGYGSVSAGNAFVEGTPAPANPIVAAPGSSIRLLPDGHATSNNAADFMVTSTPSPRATNQ